MSMNESFKENSKPAPAENIPAGGVARTQDELNALIEKKVIYLDEGHFTLPANVPNVTYIGTNMPTAEFEGVPFEKGIHIEGVKLDISKYPDENYDLLTGDDTKSRENFYRFLDSNMESLEITSAKGQCVIGIYYLSKENHSEATNWLRRSAEQGFAEAQFLLGAIYDEGRGADRDEQEAVKWYRMSAEQGNAKAQLALGRYYEHVEETKQKTRRLRDYREAVQWYLMAAESGNAEAQRILGDCYLTRYFEPYGPESEDDDFDTMTCDEVRYRKWFELAVKWLRKAAEQDDAEAQYKLGEVYYNTDEYNNLDVAADFNDPKEGIKWYRKAAEQGHVGALEKLGNIYSLEHNDSEAAKWYRMGAELGSAESQYRTGRRSDDEQEALKWFRMAAEQGHLDAQLSLGDRYERGAGCEKDAEESFKWYRMAAEQGDYDAQQWVGDAYFKGFGVERDTKEAEKWYRIKAEQGDYYAQQWLGDRYSNGNGVEKDAKEAEKWYRKGAEEDGCSYYQYKLGERYYNGDGVAKNIQEAKKWYFIAASQGDTLAKQALKKHFNIRIKDGF